MSDIYVNGFLGGLPHVETKQVHEFCGYICVFDRHNCVRGVLLFHDKDVLYSDIYRVSNRGRGVMTPVRLNKSAFNRAFYRGKLHVCIPDSMFGFIYDELYFMQKGHAPKSENNRG